MKCVKDDQKGKISVLSRLLLTDRASSRNLVQTFFNHTLIIPVNEAIWSLCSQPTHFWDNPSTVQASLDSVTFEFANLLVLGDNRTPRPEDYDFDAASRGHVHEGRGGEHDLDGGRSRAIAG